MKTRVLHEEDIALAARMLREGKLVAFPTETVYGLGANALDSAAVRRVFSAKGRPQDNPLIVHVSSVRAVAPLVKAVPPAARRLMREFWPGPLSIVFEKSDLVPGAVTAALDTVVIRMPSHRLARALIRLAGVPVAAPSANSSGKPSPTSVEHVLEDLAGKVDAVLDGGLSRKGVESTVIDVRTRPITVLRQGAIPIERLEEAVGKVRLATLRTKASSPGMRHKHYAPRGELILVEGPARLVDAHIRALKRRYPRAAVLRRSELKASKLFSVLRSADAEAILCPSVPEEGLGRTVMDRLRRAATRIVDARQKAG